MTTVAKSIVITLDLFSFKRQMRIFSHKPKLAGIAKDLMRRALEPMVQDSNLSSGPHQLVGFGQLHDHF